MSQIFDALHQSASERVSNVAREFSTAKDLLEVVERKTPNTTVLADISTTPSGHESSRAYPSIEPHCSASSKFVCFNQPESLAAEKFRFLATRLRHLQQKRSLKRLVITSSVSGEGKSVVAGNLAYALASGRQQVLLVEGDLRRPSLAQQLGLHDVPGLSQMLRGASDTRNNIYCLGSSGLHFLLAGEVHNNPLEFMEPGKLSTLMDQISDRFDWVVIDSPPVLPLADTSMWVRIADGILLVMRPGVTSKKQLQRTYEALEQSKLLGSILNASNETKINQYYQHYTRSNGLQMPGSSTK